MPCDTCINATLFIGTGDYSTIDDDDDDDSKVRTRDVKPDNILLNEQGHAHLTDFNIAMPFNKDRPLMSVAGSMAYMAPEILEKRGYTCSVDWWSLGIVCYELLVGKVSDSSFSFRGHHQSFILTFKTCRDLSKERQMKRCKRLF